MAYPVKKAVTKKGLRRIEEPAQLRIELLPASVTIPQGFRA